MSEFRQTPHGLLHQPKNTLPAVKELWAFVSVDPQDGNEGVMCTQMGAMLAPLIAADRARLEQFWPLARRAARQHSVHVRLVRFSTREVVVDDVLRGQMP
jgi:hypothetical protein